MNNSPDDRPPMVVAAQWTSRITTVSLEMVLPGVFGLWIDRQLGTVLLFLVLGVVLGMTTGMIHLVRMTKEQGSGRGSTKKAPLKKPAPKKPES